MVRIADRGLPSQRRVIIQKKGLGLSWTASSRCAIAVLARGRGRILVTGSFRIVGEIRPIIRELGSRAKTDSPAVAVLKLSYLAFLVANRLRHIG